MEGDLISRSELLKKAVNMIKYDEEFGDVNVPAVNMWDVEEAPAVDAEPVIRCRDCKHWDNDKHWNNDVAKTIYAGLCSYIGLTTGCEFYCAKGERDGGAEES